VVSELLQHFISENVCVTTDATTSYQLEDGQIATGAFVVEGELLDYDDTFLFLSNGAEEVPELIPVSKVVSIRVVNEVTAEMTTGKPSKKDMN
jgi:hypothetical protein